MSNVQRLQNLADGEAWTMPASSSLLESLDQLERILGNISSDTGFSGESEKAAVEQFAAMRSATHALAENVRTANAIVEKANATRDDARAALSGLGAGGLSSGQTNTIRAAAAGSTVVFGPLTLLAGEGAIAAANAFLGDQRDDRARDAADDVEAQIDAYRDQLISNSTQLNPGALVPPAGTTGIASATSATMTASAIRRSSSGSGARGGVGSGRDVATPIGSTPPAAPAPQPYATIDPDGRVFEGGQDTGIQVPREPGGSTIVVPTPDGPISSGATSLPPSLTGGGGAGMGTGLLGSGGGALLGSGGGLTSGLMVGAGGAAALGAAGKLSAGGLGALGTSKLVGGIGSGGALGAGGAAGAGGGRLGAGGIGGVGGAVGGANSGRGTSGGLLGSRGGAAASGVGGTSATGVGGTSRLSGSGASTVSKSGGAAAAGGRGSASGTGVAGGGSAQAGGRKNDRRAPQSNGLVAPRIEDEDDFGPQSENAGAGGRD